MAKTTHGTLNQFIDSVKSKIDELSTPNEITTAINATDVYDEGDDGSIDVDDDSYNYEKDYVKSLMIDIESNLYPYADSVNYQIHDSDVAIVVVSDKGIREYIVPFDDLTMDPEDHGPDVDYITNFIDRDLNISDENEYEGYTPDDWKPLIIEKLESEHVDVTTPEAEDYIDQAAEWIQDDDDHDVNYWWNEVMSNDNWRQEVNDLPHIGLPEDEYEPRA